MLVAMSTTATVLGFFVLAALAAATLWGCVILLRMVSTWYDNWRYTRRRRRKNDEELDGIRSAWLREKFDMENPNRTDTVEAKVVSAVDRTPTLEMDLTVNDILTYSKENKDHDVA